MRPRLGTAERRREWQGPSEKMEPPFLSQMMAVSMWKERDGYAVKDLTQFWKTLKQVFWWNNTCSWKSTKALNTMVDFNTHSGWKQKWIWHNRGGVWDKLASKWARAEEWTERKDKKLGMRSFGAFAFERQTFCHAQTKKSEHTTKRT